MKPLKLLFLLICTVFFFYSCDKDKDNNPEPDNPFDKEGLLINYADAIILPNYNSFKLSLDSLVLSFDVFKTSASLSDFQLVKQKLHVAYLKYQTISLTEFGPAESEIVRMNFNVFPTDTAQIIANIASGTYDLSAASNLDAKGFPALDYLFYGKNSSENSMSNLLSSSTTRKQYVTDILNEMTTKTNAVITTWNTTYRSQFISSLNTDIGSSIGYLVNQLNFELDYLKNAKVGIPLGKKTLNIPLPEKCEAYFGTQSLPYAVATLNIIEDIYLGRSKAGIDGKGFDDYLNHLGASYGSGTLDAAIKNQFSIAKTKLAAISNPISVEVISNPNTVDAAYVELVKLLVLLKTDMPSNLGVIITYQDGDGD
ncbi:MAG: imelysin family protein [Bacteroidetes bacterium]|nr:imelysin family protein [Bacteroidota bacterium]